MKAFPRRQVYRSSAGWRFSPAPWGPSRTILPGSLNEPEVAMFLPARAARHPYASMSAPMAVVRARQDLERKRQQGTAKSARRALQSRSARMAFPNYRLPTAADRAMPQSQAVSIPAIDRTTVPLSVAEQAAVVSRQPWAITDPIEDAARKRSRPETLSQMLRAWPRYEVK